MSINVKEHLGIFWLVPHPDTSIAILSCKVPLSAAEEYGDCLTCPISHYESWEETKQGRAVLGPLDASTRALISRSEYEEWPRGRIVFDRSAPGFIIYADRQAIPHKTMICERFGLPEGTILRMDQHYSRTRRLPEPAN